MDESRAIFSKLNTYKLAEYQDIAKKFGLDYTGVKRILKDRIKAYLENIFQEYDKKVKTSIIDGCWTQDSNIDEEFVWNPLKHQYLLARNICSVKEFISELKLPVNDFQIEEYWIGWNNPSRYLIVN